MTKLVAALLAVVALNTGACTPAKSVATGSASPTSPPSTSVMSASLPAPDRAPPVTSALSARLPPPDTVPPVPGAQQVLTIAGSGPHHIKLPTVTSSVKTITFIVDCTVGDFKLTSGTTFFGGNCKPGVRSGGGLKVARMDLADVRWAIGPGTMWQMTVWASS